MQEKDRERERKKKEILTLDEERIDEIGFGNLKLIQNPKAFCYGVDAVILADFAAKYARGKTELLFDLGTGTGIIPLILSYKTQISHFIGVEMQKEAYRRALRSVTLNGLEKRISLIHGDVKDTSADWGRDFAGKADMVVSNPPYIAGNEGMTSENKEKMTSRHETTAGLADFIKGASWLLKEKGDFFLVHRPSRIVDICWEGRKYGLEPKELRFVSPNRESKPNILLVHMVKGGGREVKMLPPLYVYDMEGNYTSQLKEAYR